MGRSFNPAGSEVYEASFDLRRRHHGRVLGLEGTAESHRAKGGSVRSGQLVGNILGCGSGLVWQTPGLRRGGGHHVQARPRESNGSMDRFDRRASVHRGSQRRAMDS